jgi:predicted ATPase
MAARTAIRTPDQRLRVFVSSTLGELAEERAAVRRAVEQLRLVPVMFELGARPHPPRELYRAYLRQSQVFVGIYWQRYGWIAPGEEVSGLEDELRLGRGLPGLLYLKQPAPDREPRLRALLDRIRADDRASYRNFATADELAELVMQDLAVLLSERFEATAGTTDGSPGAAMGTDVVAPGAPVPLGSLVGRDREVAAIAGRLRSGSRLVTVTGTGGIGKTRVALAVAHEVADLYPDGVHVVPLDSVEEVALVLPTLAARLGVRLTGTEDAGAALAGHLAGRRALLVLDNLEQVVEVAPRLVDLLERCPQVQVLATSRRPLQVAGEQEWRLEPLVTVDPAAPFDEISGSAAVELFVERARAVDPTFAVGPSDAAAVAAVCQRLDGLPLAIELAAARVRLLPPPALLRRLGARLDLLSGGADRPERHRTVRATIDWSTRLLSDTERTVFARLSVFAGGCSLTAAEAVCDLQGRGDVVDHVAALLDQGLLVVADDRDDDEPRVRMLETVRAAAADQLAASGEAEVLGRRHLEWFAELADRAQPFLCGPDQVRWMARIDPERANLRIAARRGLELGEHATVLEMAWDLYVYYHLRGAHQEPEAWIAAVDTDRLDGRQRAIAAAAAGISELWRGELASARARLQTALVTFTEQGQVFELAVAELNLAACSLAEGAWDAAAETAEEAAERFARIEHDWGIGSCHGIIGTAAVARGDRAAARAALEAALDVGRRIDNAAIAADALTALAAMDLEADERACAARRLAEAVPLLARTRDLVGVATSLEVAAALAAAAGETRHAVDALATAEATRARTAVSPPPVVRDRLRPWLDHLPTVDAAVASADPFGVLGEVAAAVSRSDAA